MSIVLPEWAVATRARREHIERVAALLERWAAAMTIDATERARWHRAAVLHDAFKDAPLADQRAAADDDPWGVDALLHGPAAAALATRHGERDRGVLDAVRYHSVGYAEWDDVGRMLYLADYLEPGRAFPTADRARRVPRDPDTVLCEVAQDRVARATAAGRILLPETSNFLDSLECDD